MSFCLFVLSFFPRGVLDEILNLIESVSEGFPTYSSINSPERHIGLYFEKQAFMDQPLQQSVTLNNPSKKSYRRVKTNRLVFQTICITLLHAVPLMPLKGKLKK